MVIKGSARGGPAKLADHLKRTDTNEKMRVTEIRGVAAKDIDGALREMDALGAGLNTPRTLYHASINTPAHERMTPEQKAAAIDRLEERLGLSGQPRVVVEHTKKDRDHIHIVWSRTDLDHMRAIRCDHNYRTHETVARELEREFGHARVQGAHAERDGKARPDRTPGHDEMQQAERSGMTPQQAKAWVTKTWRATDSGKAFKSAIEGQGWILARGDRRDFVLLDPAGNVHGLTRRVEGATAADIRARMADVDREALPTVAKARKAQGVPRPQARSASKTAPGNMGTTASPTAARTKPANTPAPLRTGAAKTVEPRQAAQPRRNGSSRIAGNVAKGVTGAAGSFLDWVASSFERVVGGDSQSPQPEKPKGHAMPEPVEKTPHEQVVSAEEARATRRQALMEKYGGAIETGREAEIEAGVRKRDEDRSR